jgi:hypothetical protein
MHIPYQDEINNKRESHDQNATASIFQRLFLLVGNGRGWSDGITDVTGCIESARDAKPLRRL